MKQYGWANILTSIRFVLIICIGFFEAEFSNYLIALFLTIALTFDFFDGIVARKTNSNSKFGEHYDMETDALFVLLTCCLLVYRGLFPEWIIIVGLLRYLHVLVRYVFPKKGTEDSKQRFASWVAGFLFISLLIPFITNHYLGTYLLTIVSLLVLYSFARPYFLRNTP